MLSGVGVGVNAGVAVGVRVGVDPGASVKGAGAGVAGAQAASKRIRMVRVIDFFNTMLQDSPSDFEILYSEKWRQTSMYLNKYGTLENHFGFSLFMGNKKVTATQMNGGHRITVV
jgi:hypothetical protein